MTIAIGYVRVSTDEQHLGPEAQRQQLEAYASRNGLELAEVHEDLGVSGAAPIDRRPGLMAAVGAIGERGAAVLLVARRDRLARDVVVAAFVDRLVEKAGARVATADGSANGTGPEAELMRSILDAFAQYERALIRSRIKAALDVKRSRGERVGDIPYGSALGADGKTLVMDRKEQQAVRRIRTMRANGHSLRSIARYLEAHGMKCRGKRWHPTTVMRVLRRAEAA